MSLVDYAASSDEEDEPQNPSHEVENEQLKNIPEIADTAPAPLLSYEPIHSNNRMFANLRPPSSKKAEIDYNPCSELKLPDASFLLNSPSLPSNLPNILDHLSRVSSAIAESAARKRELTGLTVDAHRSKLPKRILPHSKAVSDAVGRHFLPPQLAGRSNIVTEDINKLFVRQNVNPSME